MSIAGTLLTAWTSWNLEEVVWSEVLLRGLEIMGMENFQKAKKLDIGMKHWEAGWDGKLGIVLGSTWELGLWFLGTGSNLPVWLLRVIGNSVDTWGVEWGGRQRGAGDTTGAAWSGIIYEEDAIETFPWADQRDKKGDRQGLAAVQTGAAFQMVLLHQNQLFKMNSMYGIWVKLQGWVGIAGPPAVCRGVPVVKTELYIYF